MAGLGRPLGSPWAPGLILNDFGCPWGSLWVVPTFRKRSSNYLELGASPELSFSPSGGRGVEIQCLGSQARSAIRVKWHHTAAGSIFRILRGPIKESKRVRNNLQPKPDSRPSWHPLKLHSELSGKPWASHYRARNRSREPFIIQPSRCFGGLRGFGGSGTMAFRPGGCKTNLFLIWYSNIAPRRRPEAPGGARRPPGGPQEAREAQNRSKC